MIITAAMAENTPPTEPNLFQERRTAAKEESAKKQLRNLLGDFIRFGTGMINILTIQRRLGNVKHDVEKNGRTVRKLHCDNEIKVS